jgi:predicted Fe-Mo cluster-binding NifX family protein
MKIAITATQNNLSAPMDGRFGRCAHFILLDTSTGHWQAYPNPAVNAGGGAGTQAAQFLANQSVKVVISGEFGPKASATLQAAGIHMVTASAGKVSDNLEAYQSGLLD